MSPYTAETAVRVFSFFAVVTSFLGVGLGCVDFFADVLKSAGVKGAGDESPGNKVKGRLLPMVGGLLISSTRDSTDVECPPPLHAPISV